MINFYLMTEKGFNVLSFLVKSGHKYIINRVVIGKDRNLVNDFSNEIEKICTENEIAFCYRNELLNSDSFYSIAISWRWLILGISNLIVIHDSLLPKYRGFAPLVNSLINGETEIGVTSLFADKEFDKGDCIFQAKRNIEYPIKIREAIQIISDCYTEVIELLINRIAENLELPRTPQNHKDSSYSLWLDEENYHVNWNKSSEEIKRFVDATGFPYKSAYSIINQTLVSILDVEVYEDVNILNREVGKVIFIKNSSPVVVCGIGLLKINKLVNRETGVDMLPLSKFRTRFK